MTQVQTVERSNTVAVIGEDSGAANAAAFSRVAVLTGGDDRSYALGLAGALLEHGIGLDFIGSDAVDGPVLHTTPLARFLNLRGDQSPHASLWRKVMRLTRYYFALLRYSATAPRSVLHILWNNKFEYFDRTLLMLFYRLCGHRVVLTAHNVNAAERDGKDTWLNRLTLRIQYRLCHHLFVHTQRMREQLTQYGVGPERVSVIPFGINDTTPKSDLTGVQARAALGLAADDHVVLFFGQIAPYKGLEFLASALPTVMAENRRLKLVIAGKVKKGFEPYWQQVRRALDQSGLAGRIVAHIEHIADDHVERYFKAADVLVVPYVDIFQSGVPFLAYSFGVPVIATDVGALREDIVEGQTGFVCRPMDPADLALTIQNFFRSSLYQRRDQARSEIREHALDRYSWSTVAAITVDVYRSLGLRV
jgi:glycosyltransferase involved in cell wall biosynthesis